MDGIEFNGHSFLLIPPQVGLRVCGCREQDEYGEEFHCGGIGGLVLFGFRRIIILNRFLKTYIPSDMKDNNPFRPHKSG